MAVMSRAATTRRPEQDAKMAPRRCFQIKRGSALLILCISVFFWCANDSAAVVTVRAACGVGYCCRVLYLGRHKRLRLIGLSAVCEPSTHSWLPAKRILAVTEM